MVKQNESKLTVDKDKKSVPNTKVTRKKSTHTTKKTAGTKKKVAAKTARIEASDALISLAKESFRFNATFENILRKLDEPNQKRYRSSYPWFKKKIQDVIEEAGLQIVDLTDQKYEQGMSVTVMNMGDFNEDDELFVDQMIEPIITSKSGLVSSGVVLLRRR